MTTIERSWWNDGLGNRISKSVKITENGNTTSEDFTYYIRDVQGNILSTYSKTGASLVLDEQMLYGSDLLGVWKPFVGGGMLQNTYPNFYSRKIGDKQYSIKDHLGNVRVTFADKKIPANGQLLDFYTETQSVSTYYPFGWEVKPLSWAFDTYKFGFNGQEKSSEISSGNYTAKFWEYDSRIGKRWNIDPKPNTSFSPYLTFANNPVWFSDVLGDTIKTNKAGEAEIRAILTKAFGIYSSGFSFEKGALTFNENNIKFSDKVTSFQLTADEQEVFDGLMKEINSPLVTRVLFESNTYTASYGGEATFTKKDFPDYKEQIIYIDPAEFVKTKIGENNITMYKTEMGDETTSLDKALKDVYGKPVFSRYKKVDVFANDSKAARFFHGLGHILFQYPNVQEEVIHFDNKARSIFKKPNKKGTKFKPNPEGKRSIDLNHKNKEK